MWYALIITLVNIVLVVFYAQAVRADRETARMVEKRRRDVTSSSSIGYGMPYPTTTPPALDVTRSADDQGAGYRSAIVKLRVELHEATAERDKARAELATLKRSVAVRAFDDQKRCRDLLDYWDYILSYDEGRFDLDALRCCRDQLAEALQAEKVAVETFCQTDPRTVRTYR